MNIENRLNQFVDSSIQIRDFQVALKHKWLKLAVNDGVDKIDVADNMLNVHYRSKFMKEQGGAYDKVWKRCDCCNHKSIHLVEATISTCTECNQTTDSDADALLGEIE